MGTIASLQVEQARALQDIKALVASCATQSELESLSRRVEQCAVAREMRQLENRMAPLIQESQSTLERNKTEQQAIRELVVRFDEIISTKINREALNDLEHSLALRFISEFQLNQKYSELIKSITESKVDIETLKVKMKERDNQ